MGGIKNREEKKKKNHVFSSGGGGGGTKGPDKIDKRNQELPCPHCDRIFKQVQRLRDHVAKQHIEQSSETVEGEDVPMQAEKVEKVMDIGSGPGAWTKKSPRLLLLEWTQTSKRPKPRYKALLADDGRFRCKVGFSSFDWVVLPDAKDDKNDVVVFLNAAQACNTEEDALQSGALAALHAVAGDRNLHRILPAAFGMLWDTLSEENTGIAQPEPARLDMQAKQKKEQIAHREAREEAQKAREKARKAAEARRKPSQVVMSEQKRQLVESALKGTHIQSRTSNPETTQGAAIPVEQATVQLQALGFTADQAAMASAAVCRSDDISMSNALDWLCLHLPTEALPPAFAPAAADRQVEVLRPVENARDRSDASGQIAASAIQQLTGFGYSELDAMCAIASQNGDTNAAHVLLYNHLTGTDLREAFASQPPPDWQEEVQAISAIHANNFQQKGLRRMDLCVDDGRTYLDLRIPDAYPETPPLIAVRSRLLGGGASLELTRQLAELSTTLIGSPMVYDLAIACEELLGDRNALQAHPSNQQLTGTKDSITGAPCTMDPAADDQDDPEKFTPSDGDDGKARTFHRHVRRDGNRFKLSASELPAESKRLMENQVRVQRETGSRMQASRRKLPAFSMRAQFLSKLNSSQVLVISGTTGCGKSTQVPQYILEDAIAQEHGAECNIICTQPRRISAIGLAQRVSQERGEAVGKVVGYSVRFDTTMSRQTRLLFCTTGILLRRLISDPELRGVTHVIVDEVHERSVDSDLLLLLLKILRKERGPKAPKIILMSATADADLFSSYFTIGSKASVSQLGIPGFTHPVQEFYLEDALELTQTVIGPKSKWAKRKKAEDAKSLPSALGRPAPQHLQPGPNPASWDQVGFQPLQTQFTSADYSVETRKSLAWVDESLINNDVIEALICKIMTPGSLQPLSRAGRDIPHISDVDGPRAILVFLPGAPEIDRLIRQLTRSSRLAEACRGRKLNILPLHGSLGPSQQAKVFEAADSRVQKIVVATNVAETSITIPDVVCVIDTGRVKEMSYDTAKGLSRLEEGWVSLAAATQRQGRAGRVQPGLCFKLFSHKTASSLQEHQAPEIRRTALHQLCLTLKAILPQATKLGSVLSSVLTPPESTAVASAVSDLQRMGALESGEHLTALGRHLASMPMHPQLGKALVYAALLRCLDPVLTIVSALSYGRPVFQAPPDRREEANAAKRELADVGAAAKSDHLTIIAAFNMWNLERASNGHQAARQVSSKYFLSEAAMEGILSGRRDFAKALVELGFIPQTYLHTLDELPQDTAQTTVNEFSGNARIVKAAICAGFYPSLLRVEHPADKYAETYAGAFAVDAPPQKLRFIDRDKGRVFIHPGSVLFNVGRFECPWLIYTDMTETSKVYCREASMVPIYSLLLFGGSVSVEHEKSLLKLDDWAQFKASPQTAVLVKMLRADIDRLLLEKMEDPSFDLSASKTINALHQLLATDGF